MDIPFTQKKLNGLTGCLLSIPTLLFIGIIGVIGQQFYDEISPYIIVGLTIIILGVIVSMGNTTNKKYADEVKENEKMQTELRKIVGKYNAKVSDLEKSCKSEIATLVSPRSLQKQTIRSNYSQKYLANWKEYEKERKSFIAGWDSTHKSHLKNFWQWAVVIGFIAILGACSFSMGVSIPPEPDYSDMSAVMQMRTWSADNIPMPHMTDGSQYVSNPDSILSQEVVDSINVVLRQMDDQFDIESAMVIVGHIENDDPIAMVRGIYKNYGVGKNNRGLVIVVGYLDHSYFIAPGRALEGDLTDMESDQLARRYLIPSMKAELPDSGMLYLARGTYALFASKDMPEMSSLTSTQKSEDDEDNTGGIILFIFMALLGGWCFYASSMARKLGFASTGLASGLRANPFIDLGSGFVGGGSSHGSSRSSSSSWGGSSHSSGGYGGGSWGGGGAGGRW